MRIISDFNDYYDTSMAYGQDISVVYDRKRLEFPFNVPLVTKQTYPRIIRDIHNLICKYGRVGSGSWYTARESNLLYIPNSLPSKKCSIDLSLFNVIFCGKIYTGIYVTRTISNELKYSYKEVKCFYDMKSLHDFLIDSGVDIDNYKHSRWDKKKLYERLNSCFEPHTDSLPIDWLIENKVTSALLFGGECGKLIVNPKLDVFEFYKIFDSFSCYQELDMWISGTLSYPQNFTVDIGDKYKVLEHGFDPKYGFRTRPK